ncbi:MAG: hypothetical protein EOO28_21740 [Comamonadaceae bacterium]|nr:MAG: hypothetical protein EOO28_21740 [Comamonadaceae bacterium]
MPGTEVLLMALVAGLYLYDSAMLLYANEAVLIARGRRKTWLSAFGSTGTTFRGKEFFLPNPLLPARPVFKLTWRQDEPEAAAVNHTGSGRMRGKVAHAWNDRAAPLMRFRFPLWSLGLVMFGLLPASMAMGPSGDLLLLASFVLVYLHVAVILLMLWFSRRDVGLTGRQAAAIILDLLLCPPFALNLVRRLSLKVEVNEDFVDAARRLQSPPDWQATQEALLARMDDEIRNEGDDSPKIPALNRRRETIARAPT